ncbi:hypothetical protein BGX27_007856 [Mortierella sp. AM989]|nr:hypothetical protein BGX27_007856 [Mortierella sp. AM989]
MDYSASYIAQSPGKPTGVSEKIHDVSLTAPELEYYDSIWVIANPNKENTIPGKSAAAFLSKSGLSQQSLTEIWSIADNLNVGALDRRGFNITLKLIGHVQAGAPLSAGLLEQTGSMPRFEGVHSAIVNHPPTYSQLSTTSRFITEEDKEKYGRLFQESGPVDGLISGDKVRALLLLTGLSARTLADIWDLADTQKRGALEMAEFFVAVYYTALRAVSYALLPNTLPQPLLEDCRRAAREVGECKVSQASSTSFSGSLDNPFLGLMYDAKAKEQQQSNAVLMAQQEEEQAKFQKTILDEALKQQQEQARLLQEKLATISPQYGSVAPISLSSFITPTNTYSDHNGMAQQEERAKFQKTILDEALKQQQEQARLLQEKLATISPQLLQGNLAAIFPQYGSVAKPTNTYSDHNGMAQNLEFYLEQEQQKIKSLVLLSAQSGNFNSALLESFKGNGAFNASGAPNYRASENAGISATSAISRPVSAPSGSILSYPAYSSPDITASYLSTQQQPQYTYQQTTAIQQQQPQPLYPIPPQPLAQQYTQPYSQHQQHTPLQYQNTPLPAYQRQQYQQQYLPSPPPAPLYQQQQQQQQQQQHLPLYHSHSPSIELDPIKLASVSVPTTSTATVSGKHHIPPLPRAPQGLSPSLPAGPVPQAPHQTITPQVHQQIYPQADIPRSPGAPQYRGSAAPQGTPDDQYIDMIR